MQDLTPLSRYEAANYMEYNHYIVTGVVRTGGTGSMARTKRYAVVCKDVQRAIELACKDINGLEVQSVAHQGQIQRVEV